MNKITSKEKEEINQIVSRTDCSGNEKAEIIEEFATKYAKRIIEENFCDGSPMFFDECTIEQLVSMHSKVDKLVDWVNTI